MPFSGGMDVSARDCQGGVIDDALALLVQEKVRHDRSRSLTRIEPCKAPLQIVVESPFQWYGSVDGLQKAGYQVCLAHTSGLPPIPGATVKTDRRHALAVAKRLKASMSPKANIYPQETRPVRDLLRQRSRPVALRATESSSLRRRLLRHGRLDHSRNDIQQTPDQDLMRWLAHPLVRRHGQHELQRIDLYPQQSDTLAAQLLATGQDCPAFHRLLTIPGRGKRLAMTIVDELGEMARFQNAREFASSCRLVPEVAQSGPVSRRGRHAKQGSPHLKWAFGQAAR